MERSSVFLHHTRRTNMPHNLEEFLSMHIGQVLIWVEGNWIPWWKMKKIIHPSAEDISVEPGLQGQQNLGGYKMWQGYTILHLHIIEKQISLEKKRITFLEGLHPTLLQAICPEFNSFYDKVLYTCFLDCFFLHSVHIQIFLKWLITILLQSSILIPLLFCQVWRIQTSQTKRIELCGIFSG